MTPKEVVTLASELVELSKALLMTLEKSPYDLTELVRYINKTIEKIRRRLNLKE